jgi:hypothetical protein
VGLVVSAAALIWHRQSFVGFYFFDDGKSQLVNLCVQEVEVKPSHFSLPVVKT